MRALALLVSLVLMLSGASAPQVWAQTAKKKMAAPAEKVDLNSATEKELEALPGVGPATAKKIIAGRPYAAPQDLSKAGVSAKTIEKLTPLVIGGAAAPSAPATAPGAAPAAPKQAATPSAAPTKPEAMEAKTPPAKGMVWVNTKSGVFHTEGDCTARPRKESS